MKQRTDKLLAAMPGGFEAALVSTDVNRFYFLGFRLRGRGHRAHFAG